MRERRAAPNSGSTWPSAKLPSPTIAQRIRSAGSSDRGGPAGRGWPCAVCANAWVAESASGAAAAAASRWRRVRSVSDMAASLPLSGSATMHVSARLSCVGRRHPFHHPTGERGPPPGAHAGGGERVAGPLVAGVARGVLAGGVVEYVVGTVAIVAHAIAL